MAIFYCIASAYAKLYSPSLCELFYIFLPVSVSPSSEANVTDTWRLF